jgi:hypothetical protein
MYVLGAHNQRLAAAIAPLGLLCIGVQARSTKEASRVSRRATLAVDHHPLPTPLVGDPIYKKVPELIRPLSILAVTALSRARVAQRVRGACDMQGGQ